jgi:hypothetical protein
MVVFMKTAQRSRNQFCARPDCGLARSLHGRSLPCVGFVAPSDAPTKVSHEPIDSSLLDRVLMAGALEHMQGQIKNATMQLQMGLLFNSRGAHDLAKVSFEAALKTLGSLGAS